MPRLAGQSERTKRGETFEELVKLKRLVVAGLPAGLSVSEMTGASLNYLYTLDG